MSDFYKREEIPDDLLQYFDAVTPEPTGCVVLDPFMGSGTVAAVAASLGRNYIGFELNPSYIALAQERLRGVCRPLIPEAV